MRTYAREPYEMWKKEFCRVSNTTDIIKLINALIAAASGALMLTSEPTATVNLLSCFPVL